MRLLDDSRFLRVCIYACGRKRGKKRNNKPRTILNENFYKLLVIEEFLARWIFFWQISHFLLIISKFLKKETDIRENCFFVSNLKFNFFQIISRHLQISLTYVLSIVLCMQIKTDTVLNR